MCSQELANLGEEEEQQMAAGGLPGHWRGRGGDAAAREGSSEKLRLILWPRFADGDARLVDQRLAFLCRHLPHVCQFHLLSIQL